MKNIFVKGQKTKNSPSHRRVSRIEIAVQIKNAPERERFIRQKGLFVNGAENSLHKIIQRFLFFCTVLDHLVDF